MTEYRTTERRESDLVEDDLRDLDDEAARTAERVGDKLGDAAKEAEKDASSVGRKVSDAIEDVIPGDSDSDGH
jgi:hypothetical protein